MPHETSQLNQSCFHAWDFLLAFFTSSSDRFLELFPLLFQHQQTCMEMACTLPKMPFTQLSPLSLHQTMMDSNTCTSAESWLVNTRLVNKAWLLLHRRTRVIPKNPLIVWWIKLLTRAFLLFSMRGSSTLNT